MKEAMYKRYADKKPVGAYAFCNTFGLHIYEPDEIDKYDCELVCSWHNGEREWGFHKHQIHYTTSGRAFVRKGSQRIYLDEVMKVS